MGSAIVDFATQGLIFAGSKAGDRMAGTSLSDQLWRLGGDDIRVGEAGDDYVNGGLGNDILRGGLGNDRYIFELGSGVDRIEEVAGVGIDGIEIYGTTSVQTTVYRELLSSDFVLNSRSDKVTLAGQYDPISGAPTGSIEMMLLDGEFYDLAAVGLVFDGTERADRMVGTSFDRTFFASNGDDVVSVVSGADFVFGDAGDDNPFGAMMMTQLSVS